MEHRMNKDELIELLDSLEIRCERILDFVLFPDAGDLDLAVTKKGLEQLKLHYELQLEPNGLVYRVTDNIECFVDEYEDWKVEKWGKYNLESIYKYYDYLKSSSREKDKIRLAVVEEYLSKQK